MESERRGRRGDEGSENWLVDTAASHLIVDLAARSDFGNNDRAVRLVNRNGNDVRRWTERIYSMNGPKRLTMNIR